MTLKSPVTRFNLDMDGSMVPTEGGCWVRSEAHDQLVEKFVELLKRFERVVESAEVHEANTDWYARAQAAITAFKEL